MIGNWLLCDFHIHTSFSDGTFSLEKVVQLFGDESFDAICISDHIIDDATLENCRANDIPPHAVEKPFFPDYCHALWVQARFAWEEYHMLVIPGVEITNNVEGYHILALDIKDYIDPGLPVERIVEEIHRQEGIAVAPHPHRGSNGRRDEPMYLWNHHEEYVSLFDAWEVANRDDLFTAIGLKKFNYLANSDFHEHRHLYSWKTLLQCEKNVEAVKSEIRNNKRISIYLLREGQVL